MRRFFLMIYCLFMTCTAQGFELFGVNLVTTDRAAFREVIKNSGAEVIREAGDDNWYDIYNLSARFKESRRLFVGYNKQTTALAFAEYQLPYDYLMTMLQRMRAKYGAEKKTYGRFASDTQYRWVIDGVNIVLMQDWHSNQTRLIYSLPGNLAALRQDYRQSKTEEFTKALNINENYF